MDIFFKDTIDGAIVAHSYDVSDESYRYRAIMRENALTLQISMPTFVDIPVGAYCEFKREIYTLYRPQNFKKNNTRNFDYTLIMESSRVLLGMYKFRDIVYAGGSFGGSKRLKFSLTAKPLQHLQMVVDNLNQRDSGWSIGSCVDAVEQVLSYNHTNCDEVLNMISTAFKTEYEFDGKKISLKKVEYNKTLTDALELSYGFGKGFKPGVKRDNFDQSKAIEILYVQGGERNVIPKDGVSELILPKNTTIKFDGLKFEGEDGFVLANARSYISDADGMSIQRSDKPLKTHSEGSLDCAHIYPERVGIVTGVTTIHDTTDPTNTDKDLCDFFDADTAIGAWENGLPLVAIQGIPSDLDYSKCRVDGEKATVIFQSGMLAGKEFDIMQTDKSLGGYIHSERRFKLVQQQVDGVPMPTGVFVPHKGDKYAVFGISLPTSYVAAAKLRMFKEAVKYLYENEDDRFSFTGELDGIWAKNNWSKISGKIKLGGYVAFSDSNFLIDPSLIRVVGIKDFINNPYTPQIELSNVTVGGNSLNSALGQITQNEVVVEDGKRDIIRFAKRGFKAAQETSAMLESSFLGRFSNGISPMTVQTMQMLIGDESLQFEFVDTLYDKTSNPYPTKQNCPFELTEDGKLQTPQTNPPTHSFIQHFTLGQKVMSTTKGSAANFRYWEMSAFDSGVLDISNQGYYLYAKVPIAGSTVGSYELSSTAILLKQLDDYYYLLIGVLTSEIDGVREFSTLYGFTEILPGRITTEKIVSSDGNTFFDLEHGKIGGKIEFSAGSSGYSNLADRPDLHDYALATSIVGLQNQIDGQVIAWFDSYVPTTSTKPASDWYVAAVGTVGTAGYVAAVDTRAVHANDTFTNITTGDSGKSYRWAKVDDAWSWIEITDTSLALALKNAGLAQAAAAAAAEVAATAQSTASTAKTYTDALANDRLITPDEKFTLKQKWDLIITEATVTTGKIRVQAITFGVSTTIFDTAYTALNTYLITTLDVFGDMKTNTTIDRDDWDTKWKGYYEARTSILNDIAAKAKMIADGKMVVFTAQPTVPYSVGDLWLKDKELYTCKTARLTGDFSLNDWKVATKYTDDSSIKYLKDAIKGTTDIDGGLVATNLLMLKSSADGNPIVGGMSGIANDEVGFWTGGTHAQAIDKTAKCVILKDGSLYAAGGKMKALSDGTLHLEFRKIINGGDIIIDINSTTGIISTRKVGFDNSISEMSVDGLIVNGGNVQAISAANGRDFKASIVGLGFGNVQQQLDGDALCGVYGSASNSNANPAPSWGGYFQKLKANGFYGSVKNITDANYYDTQYLTEYDYVVNFYAHNSFNEQGNSEVILPLKPQIGQHIIIKVVNNPTLVVYGNLAEWKAGGYDIVRQLADATLVLNTNNDQPGISATFIFDGTYWMAYIHGI